MVPDAKSYLGFKFTRNHASEEGEIQWKKSRNSGNFRKKKSNLYFFVRPSTLKKIQVKNVWPKSLNPPFSKGSNLRHDWIMWQFYFPESPFFLVLSITFHKMSIFHRCIWGIISHHKKIFQNSNFHAGLDTSLLSAEFQPKPLAT